VFIIKMKRKEKGSMKSTPYKLYLVIGKDSYYSSLSTVEGRREMHY